MVTPVLFSLGPQPVYTVVLGTALLLTASLWRRRPGLFLIVLGIGDFAIAATRGDLSLFWGPLLAVQWADLLVVAVGVALELASHRLDRPTTGS